MFHTRATIVVTLLLLAGCRGDDEAEIPQMEMPAGTHQPTVPICEAVLPGELELFTGGRTFKPGETRVAKPDMHQCEWEPAQDESGKIVLTLYPLAETALSQYKSLTGMEKVEGPGTETWWSQLSQTYVVLLGERLLVVGFGAPAGDHQQQAQKIVQRAMERL